MDDFEQEVTGALQHRVAGMPATYDVQPTSIARARRRRATKVGALGAAVVLVVVGTVGAVVQASRNDHGGLLSTGGPSTTTSPPHTTSVPTRACPVTYAITPDKPWPPPVTTPRAVPAGVADSFVSFAATTDERYTVLAPKGWHCSATFAVDGENGMTVSANGSPGTNQAGIAILNGFLWHGGVGSQLACSVSDDAAVKAYVRANYPELGPCPQDGRTLTRVDAHTTRFVGRDGTRGAGWIVLPSSSTADDGKVSSLTCRPTAGLTAANCDAIIADWIDRVDVQPSSPRAATLAPAPYPALDWAATPGGMVITGPRGDGVAAYDAVSDHWRTYARAPFSGIPYILAVRGETMFVMAVPANANSATPFAALDLATGTWQTRAPVPKGVPLLTGTGDAGHIFGVGSFEDTGDTPAPRTIAVEYDVATDRWTTLPPSPLGARAGSELAWTGKELLVWSGGSNHQGFVPSYTDGAAYDPATSTWRVLPKAPISGRAWAAAVWTGTEMLVWGGDDCGCGKPPTGANAAYNPVTNKWRSLAESPLAPSRAPAGVWTGREFVVLGGGGPREVAVAAYDPSADTWRQLPAPPEGARAVGDAAHAAYADGRAIFAVSSDGTLAAFAYPAGS